MRIGIDIDDTLTNTKVIFQKYLKPYKKEAGIKMNEPLPSRLFYQFMKKNANEIYENVTYKKNAAKVISWLKEQGAYIVIITRRGDGLDFDIEASTKKSLKENGILYDEIVFKQISKKKEALKRELDYFIDDNEHVLDEMDESGIETLQMSETRTSKKHTVVTSWKDVKKYFETHR